MANADRQAQRIQANLTMHFPQLPPDLTPMDYQRWLAQELRAHCEEWLQANPSARR